MIASHKGLDASWGPKKLSQKSMAWQFYCCTSIAGEHT